MATRLFFRAVNFDTVAFPGSYPDSSAELEAAIPGGSTLSNNRPGADALTIHRSLKRTKGASQTSLAVTSQAIATTQTNYFSKFISDPLQGVTSLSANQWTSQIAIAESSLSANFSGIFMAVYVWRPSTNLRVGSLAYGWTANGGFAEPGAANSERLFTGNLTSGNSTLVSGVQDGDVIIVEVYARTTQVDATSYTTTFYYDGTTEYGSADQTVVSDVASYIETPQNLNFVSDVVNATSDWKDVLKQRPQALITNAI